MRGRAILERIWSGVIDEPGVLTGAINIAQSNGLPHQFKVSEEELYCLSRFFRETAREVRRRKRLQKGAKPRAGQPAI